MDGWNQKPHGWNVFDNGEYEDTIISEDLSAYTQKYIFILAGGLDHLGRNHPWVKDRLDVAIKLYAMKNRKIIILGGGTYHKPPHINKEHYVIHESTMGAKYLIDHGIEPDDIYREWASYDTIANAFFSLINFIIPLDLTDVLIITSDFHMPRSREIFKWIYELWKQHMTTSHTPSINPTFLEVSTKYLDQDIIEARATREQNSLQNLYGTMNRINTWQKFHDWFYQEHQAYNCRFMKPDESEKIDEKTRQSY